MQISFADITAETPDETSLESAYAGFNAQLDAGEIPHAIIAWEALRRRKRRWSIGMR
jgi:hypothetical protein